MTDEMVIGVDPAVEGSEKTVVEGDDNISYVKPPLKPWERIKNPRVRAEQKFLQETDTSVGTKVEMSDRNYIVTKAGWRRLYRP